jgi:hypothetical protein
LLKLDLFVVAFFIAAALQSSAKKFITPTADLAITLISLRFPRL